MITIPLTRGYETAISDDDSDLASIRWFPIKRRKQIGASRTVRVNGKPTTIYLSRVILSRMIDCEIPKGMVCDHIDRNPLNNL